MLVLLWQVADGDNDSVGDDGQGCQLDDVLVVVVFVEVLGADDDGDDEGGGGGAAVTTEALPMPLLPVETDGALLPMLLLLQLLLLFGKTTAICAGPVLMFCEEWRLLFLLFFCLLAVCFLLVNERKISSSMLLDILKHQELQHYIHTNTCTIAFCTHQSRKILRFSRTNGILPNRHFPIGIREILFPFHNTLKQELLVPCRCPRPPRSITTHFKWTMIS